MRGNGARSSLAGFFGPLAQHYGRAPQMEVDASSSLVGSTMKPENALNALERLAQGCIVVLSIDAASGGTEIVNLAVDGKDYEAGTLIDVIQRACNDQSVDW